MPKRHRPHPDQLGLFDTSATPLSGFVPSAYQQAIFDWIVAEQGDAMVRAVAGSGKSTTLIEGARLVRAERAIFLAFNKHIADSLGARLTGTAFAARTIHRVGYGVLAKAFAGSLHTDDRKYAKLAQRWVAEMFPVAGRVTQELRDARASYAQHLEKLTRFVRLTRTNPRDPAALRSLARQHGIDLRDLMAAGVEHLLQRGAAQAEQQRIIDFTDMIFLPTYLTLAVPQFNWLFIDECQDLNVAQRELVLRLRAPGGRMLFVGDPRQSVMAFAGADSSSYARILTATGAREFPLSVCYRCPTTHLDLARQEVPEIEARPGAPRGTIASVPEAALPELVGAGDLVLCRMTAPLVGWCLKLIERLIPARVRGRDIADELTSLARALGAPYATLLTRLGAYQRSQRAYLEAQAVSEAVLLQHDDRCAALATCASGFGQCRSIDELCAAIDGLFDDDAATIWLSTVHRAKGLEAARVFVLRPHTLPLVWAEQTEEEARQERNLYYVAVTRSTDVLVFLECAETVASGAAEQRRAQYGPGACGPPGPTRPAPTGRGIQ
jgi:DNA helicase-2/ATP-dependent DNA helicase PcrA